MTLAFAPPWWVLSGLCLAAVLLAVAAYAKPVVSLSWRQRVTLGGLRLSALLLLLLFLLRPVSTEPSPLPDSVVPVVIDNSRSMRLADVSGERRIDRARAVVRDDILPSVGASFEVDVFSLGDPAQPTDVSSIEPGGTHSDLASAIVAVRERYATRTVAGIVLLSDGGDTSGRDVWSAVSDLGVPVYTIGVGAPDLEVDLEVASMTAGTPGVEESVVDIEISLVAHGRDGEPVELRLEADGQLVDVRRVTPAADGAPVRMVFQVAPKNDVATVYTVEAAAVPGEAVVENNRRSVLVQPPGRARRLLMIEGAPGYDHSFLKRAWLADPGIEVDAIVRKGQNERGEPTFYIQGDGERISVLETGFPPDTETLFQYDAVVIANVEERFFRPEQHAMIREFVEQRGGGVLLFGSLTLTGRGFEGSPLDAVVPLEPSGRGVSTDYGDEELQTDRARLTRDGESHPLMQLGATVDETRRKWAALPRLGGSIALGPAKPGASVLAVVSAPGDDVRPLVAIQRFGRGRSMVFTGEAFWRWRMMLPASDRAYERFWGQAARWLTAAAVEPVTVTASRGRSPGDSVEVEVFLRNALFEPDLDASAVVRVLAPGGHIEIVRPILVDAETGLYRSRFTAAAAGVYKVEVTSETNGAPPRTATDWVLVGGADTELSDPRLNVPVLRRLSDATGGQFLPHDNLSELEELLTASVAGQAPLTSRELWHSIWSFMLVVAVLTTEWSLRRRWGLR